MCLDLAEVEFSKIWRSLCVPPYGLAQVLFSDLVPADSPQTNSWSKSCAPFGKLQVWSLHQAKVPSIWEAKKEKEKKVKENSEGRV